MGDLKSSALTSGAPAGILARFSDAKAVLETAVKAMADGDMPAEVCTAIHGLRMLNAVYDELDSAIGRLSQR